jgi:hypothetical protein
LLVGKNKAGDTLDPRGADGGGWEHADPIRPSPAHDCLDRPNLPQDSLAERCPITDGFVGALAPAVGSEVVAIGVRELFQSGDISLQLVRRTEHSAGI